jgi:hypothetical protein
VRPEEAGPQISVRQPRGSPPVRSSIAAMPLETISGAGRTANCEAGVTPASLASLEVEVEKARRGGRTSAKSSAPEGCGQTSASFSPTKTKGRPWAAEVETTAEDIDSSGKFQGTPELGTPEAFSLFIRLSELCAPHYKLSSWTSLPCSIAYLGIPPPSKPSSAAARRRCPSTCSIQFCD